MEITSIFVPFLMKTRFQTAQKCVYGTIRALLDEEPWHVTPLILFDFQDFYCLNFKCNAQHLTLGLLQQTSCARLLHSISASEGFQLPTFTEYYWDLSFYLVHDFTHVSDTVTLSSNCRSSLTLICIV